MTGAVAALRERLGEAEEALRDAEYRYAYGRTRRDRDDGDRARAFYEGRVARLKNEIAQSEADSTGLDALTQE